jgi:hypothetical protein
VKLNDSNPSRFCHKEIPSMPLVTSRHSTSFVMHRITNVRGRKRSYCNTTAQGTTLFVCKRTTFRPTAETSLPEGLDLASTDYQHRAPDFRKKLLNIQCDFFYNFCLKHFSF